MRHWVNTFISIKLFLKKNAVGIYSVIISG